MSLPTHIVRGLQFDPLDAAQREFDALFNRFLGGRGRDGAALAPYAVDVREDADHIYVEAELPGFKRNQVEITLENQTLTISAERKQEHEEKGGEQQPGQYLLNERRYARFLRSFTLPPTVDESQCQAKLADGVLTVVLDKRAESKPRKITVS